MDLEEMRSQNKCCEVDSMCGRSLFQGVVLVGVSALVVSLILLLLNIVSLIQLTFPNVEFNGHPIMAFNLIFTLVSICLSLYQIVISTLLLLQTIRTKANVFLCPVWYVSHLSILTLYFMLFVARVFIYFMESLCVAGLMTIIVGVVYEGTFIYFSIVVNSYLHSLDQAR